MKRRTMLKLTNHRHWSGRKLKTNAQSPSQSEKNTDPPFEDVSVGSPVSDVVCFLTQAEQSKERRRRRSENISNIRGKLLRTGVLQFVGVKYAQYVLQSQIAPKEEAQCHLTLFHPRPASQSTQQTETTGFKQSVQWERHGIQNVLREQANVLANHISSLSVTDVTLFKSHTVTMKHSRSIAKKKSLALFPLFVVQRALTGCASLVRLKNSSALNLSRLKLLAVWLTRGLFSCTLTRQFFRLCFQSPGDGKLSGESPPPAKRSRLADSGKRRVTFNPTVQEKTLHPVHEPPKSVTLKEAADIVVRYLDPFYTQGKFATKVREIQRLELQRLRR